MLQMQMPLCSCKQKRTMMKFFGRIHVDKFESNLTQEEINEINNEHRVRLFALAIDRRFW